MNYNGLIPELYVSDYAISLRFYRDLLGFRVEYSRIDPDFAFLSLGSGQLMTQQERPTDNHTGPLKYPYGRGTNLQIEVPSIENANKALMDAGHPLRAPIKEIWREISENLMVGSLELKVLDPDGYYLRVSQGLGFKESQQTR